MPDGHAPTPPPLTDAALRRAILELWPLADVDSVAGLKARYRDPGAGRRARDAADLRPLRLALAESWVAERFVPPARWKKWAASESVDGELAWATEATEAAVAAWESTA